MRKLLLFLLLSLCVTIYGERVKNISVSFDKDDFSVLIANEVAYISTSKFICSFGNDLSSPALPLVCINVLIKPNEELLDYSYTKTEQKLLDDVFIVACSRNTPTGITVKHHTDSIISYTLDSYPQTFVNYIGSHIINGYKCLSFDICPFRYDNVSRTLYLEQNFTFKISLQTNSSKRNVKIRQNDDAIIIRHVVNPEDVSLYDNYRLLNRQGQQATSQYEYAIITNNNLKPTFQKLANWKTQKGIRTIVLTVEEIYASYSGDSQQMKIKKALKNLYDNNSNFKYALLAGDVDVVPAQMCFVKHINGNPPIIYADECPTDLYYASFETMDWNANNNEFSGELADSVDISFDIAITRAPVSTVNNAETFVNRIITYESDPNVQTWANNILMCGKMLYNKYDYNGNGILISDTHYKGEKLYSQYLSCYLNVDSVHKVSFYDTGTDFPGGASYNFNPQNLQKELSKVNTGVSDCKICVASANDIGNSYYDVRSGMSTSFPNLTDEYTICVTKPGYVPYIAKCGNTVYMQNESVNRDYEVFSNQTIAGSNVTTSKPNGPVEINKGNTIIKGSNGVTINNSFEVKNGTSLEIRTN